ncbi:MAG: hypothetical protein PVF75_03695 [Granulosicoccaceae bacterium]|jgi:hypothetical protein
MEEIPKCQKTISVLWPSFLTAGLATVLFFAAFDPEFLLQETRFADISRLAAYSCGFFLFWLLTLTSCALTCYFRKPCIAPRAPESESD